MDELIIEAMEIELSRLDAKANAIRSVITLYRGQVSAVSQLQVVTAAKRRPARLPSGSGSSDAILRVARAMCEHAAGTPVATVAILEAVQAEGIEVIGTIPRNVVSSVLSRSDDFAANGRLGWTLNPESSSVDFDEILGGATPQKENDPTSETAVGSDAAGQGVSPPSPASSNPFARFNG